MWHADSSASSERLELSELASAGFGEPGEGGAVAEYRATSVLSRNDGHNQQEHISVVAEEVVYRRYQSILI